MHKKRVFLGLALATASLIMGCTVSFPDSELHLDATGQIDTGATLDRAVQDRSTAQGPDRSIGDPCEPGMPSSCDKGALISCDKRAVRSTPCALGCEQGRCCTDSDGDSITDCQGDCDDTNRDVFPGQTAYFSRARADGSFDYDCDGKQDREFKERFRRCAKKSGRCVGSGWAGRPPNCGKEQNFALCDWKKDGACEKVSEKETRQSCR